MNILLIYMVKTAIYIAGFYTIYFVFLSRDTKYDRNRLFIILSVIASFILPSISVYIREQGSIYYFGKTLSEVLVTAGKAKNQIVTISGKDLSSTDMLSGIYLAGVIVFSLRLLLDILSLTILVSRNKMRNDEIIYFKGFNTPGFSGMGRIFINRSLEKSEADEIIRHEQNHIDNHHFLDILLFEIILVLQWFNPFFYLINRSLRAIHEYQADRGYLKSGMEVLNYQKLLLNHIFRTRRINIYNSFSNPSLIKKRMIMMSKKPSSGSSDLKILLVIPIITFFLFSISSCEKYISLTRSETEVILSESGSTRDVEINTAPVHNKPEVLKEVTLPPPPPPPVEKFDQNANSGGVPVNKTAEIINREETPSEVFVVVEQMPDFPGGDNALMRYINSNIIYPETAKENNIQGKVIIRFAVLASGKIGNISVLKAVAPSLDNEALRVIGSLPDWIPGRQGGKAVNVWYSVPVTFQLK
jgi:TonB family protein